MTAHRRARWSEQIRARFSRARGLGVRVVGIAMLVLLVSHAIVIMLAYGLIHQNGQREIDRAMIHEQQRFSQSVATFIVDELADNPRHGPAELVDAATRRYLEINPPSESYLVVIELASGRRLVPTGIPTELQQLLDSDTLPRPPAQTVSTVETSVGALRVMTNPVDLDGQQVATLEIFAPLAPAHSRAATAARLIAFASGVSLAAGGLLLAGGLRRSLRPLRSLAQSARQTEFGDLTRRVAVPDTGDEIAKLATEFNIMLERIELAADRQRWLVASVSHELRTPVTIARGHLELLTNQLAPTDKAIETTTILRDELVRLGGMIEDLLAIARADTDDFIRVRRVGLVQWFEDLEFRLAGHPASEQLVIEPPPSVHIEVDPERLTQATINLVSNASRHNPPGTAIRVHATHDNGRISVIVSDNGDGIPDEIRAHLFEPFTRAGDAEGSTGLGLSVVKSVVDAHNGVLLVDSSPHGTTVTIELDTLRGD